MPSTCRMNNALNSRRLYHGIVARQRSAMSSSYRNNLPPCLVGRKMWRPRSICFAGKEDGSLTLTGPGGVGKTRLGDSGGNSHRVRL